MHRIFRSRQDQIAARSSPRADATMPSIPVAAPSRSMSLLSQRLGQARLQLICRLAADLLHDDLTLLRQRRRLFQEFLAGLRTIEGLDLSQLWNRERVGIERSDAVDHGVVEWRVGVTHGRRHRFVVALDLRT